MGQKGKFQKRLEAKIFRPGETFLIAYSTRQDPTVSFNVTCMKDRFTHVFFLRSIVIKACVLQNAINEHLLVSLLVNLT